MRFIRLSSIGLILVVIFAQCRSNNSNDSDFDNIVISLEQQFNPSGYAPLTASIHLETNIPASFSMTVKGRDSEDDFTHHFNSISTSHELPILGLYSNYSNTVELTAFDENGNQIGSKDFRFETFPLSLDLPRIDIEVAQRDQMVPGWTLVSYFGHRRGGNVTPQTAFIFDEYGNVRWYLDYSNHPVFSNLFYDNGMERLQNGNFYFGSNSTSTIYEIDMLGNLINSWQLDGYGFHHQVLEKPNGNFIFTAHNSSINTIEDHIVEIDRITGGVVSVWDLRESLQYERRSWPSAFADLNVDWFHGNAIEYDPDDDAIIVSGRTQGTVKLTSNNEVIWILSTHRGWSENGRGEDLTQYLLQPVDAGNQPIQDFNVLDGTANHPDFEWSWYQHAPQILSNGNVMIFDNGDNRNYTDFGPYSRAVEYEIDETNMTIKQIWQYGKERQEDTFSRIVSDVDFFENANRVFFSPGAINNSGLYGKVLEIDYSTKEVIFEATITPPEAAFGLITFHRTERLHIYPDQD